MIFNHLTSKQTLYADALYWSGANSATYLIDDFTRNANFAYDRVVSLIQKNDTRWKWSDSNNSTQDIATTDIVANQDNYTMEVEHLKILRVRMKKSDGSFITLIPIDRRQADDDLLNTYGDPKYYDKQGMSLKPLPIPNYSSTAGLEVEFQGGPNYFLVTDTTKEPGFNSLFHRLISLYASYDWLLENATAKNPMLHKILRVEKRIAEMEADLEDHYVNRDVDDAPTLRPKRVNRNNGLSL
mgnify:CR=1 FL=1